ncbi:MAG TPA: RagB/SusD family nutrient uptake outer membrane protein, partial [Myxococcaceae bacterium]|nr:RagB/SusD family nutrient uptake outer membrane protein [Myxococcaceae bacterium]
LLDQAQAHLAAGGEAFPFPLSSGFEGFDTPASFLQFNRAVKARVEVYRGQYDSALTALSESFLDDSVDADFNLGVYHVFSNGSGDVTNGLNSPNIYAHPSIMTDAELQEGSTEKDARVLAKVTTKESRTWQGVTSNLGFTQYESTTAPLAIIRNEELVLLRAEAYIGLGRFDEAITDLNTIRTRSGKLAARADLTADNIVDELLHQRRYSLLFEGGHRWIDMRRHGRLSQLPLDVEGHRVHERFPIPTPEMDARQ